jgi:hypothetical protein
MDAARRTELITRYRQGPSEVRAALAAAGDDLDRAPAQAGEWTARQIVHHLADSEMTSAIRLRRLLTEDEPRIDGYDENAFASALRYADRPIEPALAALDAARETSAQILERLSEDEWRRTGVHRESGAYGVERWLEIYADHAHDHADQIRRIYDSSTLR